MQTMNESAFKKPKASAGNPGMGVSINAAFVRGEEQWTEQVDLPSILHEVLQVADIRAVRQGNWLVLDDGWMLLPQLVTYTIDDGGALRTTTTIEVVHESHLPTGSFEYQHSHGPSLDASLRNGFDQWRQLDLAVWRDVVREAPANSATMLMEWPASEGRPAGKKRILLGPFQHAALQEAAVVNEEHPFCPCCLLTNSLDAFQSLIESDGIQGVRLYAARDAEGVAQADCRVNGEDFEQGRQALLAYVAQWPQRGFELRKQFVVFQAALPPSGDVSPTYSKGTEPVGQRWWGRLRGLLYG